MMVPVSDAIEILFLGGFLGLFGQGVRALVGLSTLANYAWASDAGQGEIFNATRLAISLIIGFLVGIAAALAFVLAGKRAGDSTADTLLVFAVVGYIGTDVIESFIRKYFDRSAPGMVNGSTQSVGVSTESFSPSLDMPAQIQRKLPVTLPIRPRLTSREILTFLTTKLYPPTNAEKWEITDPLPDDNDYSWVLNAIGEFFAKKGVRYYALSYGDLDLVEHTYSGLAAAIGILFRKLGGSYVG